MARGDRITYRPNNRSFGAFMRSSQAREPVIEAAQDVADLAGEYAPRRKDKGRVPDGAAMADSFKVNKQPVQVPYTPGQMVVGISRPNARVFVEVYNERPSAAPNEFGNKRNKRHRMLGRAGAAIGEFKSKRGL